VSEWDWPGDDLPDDDADDVGGVGSGFGGLDPSLDPSLEPEPVAGLTEPAGTSGFGDADDGLDDPADDPDLDEEPLEPRGEPAPLDYGEVSGDLSGDLSGDIAGDGEFDGQEQLAHLQHVEHMQHVQHMQHLEHLEHLERTGGADEAAGAADVAADDPPVGADPDLDPHGDDGAAGEPFPEPLALGEPPEPVDGFPWTDARLIGGDGVEPLTDLADPADGQGAPPPDELFAYAGEDAPDGEAGWGELMASPDPATSTLARFWGPGSAS
jgi:hypothetical protein